MNPAQSRRATIAAIRDGLLQRLPCEICGAEPTHAHHEDYERPYDVVFLCPKHHVWRHRGSTIDEMRESWLARQAVLELAAERRAQRENGEAAA